MSKALKVMLILVMVTVSSTGCFSVSGISVKKVVSSTEINQRSYNLGGIGAFAEVVGAGVKELALSAPLPPEKMDALVEEAERIAADNNVQLYREDDFLVTDLFPAELTEGTHVLLIYKDRTLEKYKALKAEKRRLEQAGEYQGRAREDIARKFGQLLSYSKEKIDELLKGN